MSDWTITTLRDAYRAGKISPVEIADSALDLIKQWNLHLKAYVHLSEKAMRRAARESERRFRFGNELGPLDGVPVAYKDLCYIPGTPTSCGSMMFEDDPSPTSVSSVWRRLDESGAVHMGKLNMAELAMGPTGRNMHFGDPQNPWKQGYVTGGSSSGSGCAVAGGLALAAIGTDTGGSIRVPAAFCGVVGLKPTNGRVSRNGGMTLSWTLDTFGPLTRTVGDNALVLSAIAGSDSQDTSASTRHVPDYTKDLGEEIAGIRVGVLEGSELSGVSEGMKVAYLDVSKTLERLGARVVSLSPPHVKELEDIANTIFKYEALMLHGERLEKYADQVTPEILMRFEDGRGIRGAEYHAALARRGKLIQHYENEVFSAVDVLAGPTTPIPAPSLVEACSEASGLISSLTRFTRWVNTLGAPAISVPLGFSEAGLPLAVQFVGTHFSEDLLYKVAYAVEKENGGWQVSPTFESFR